VAHAAGLSVRWLGLLFCVPLLVACENSASSFMVDSREHSVSLLREQPYFWDGTVNQSLVVSRLPHCQRKVAIYPDETTLTPIEVFAVGNRLWALHQGPHWYLVSTEHCAVQDWKNASTELPGARVGAFLLRDGAPVFVAGD